MKSIRAMPIWQWSPWGSQDLGSKISLWNDNNCLEPISANEKEIRIIYLWLKKHFNLIMAMTKRFYLRWCKDVIFNWAFDFWSTLPWNANISSLVVRKISFFSFETKIVALKGNDFFSGNVIWQRKNVNKKSRLLWHFCQGIWPKVD